MGSYGGERVMTGEMNSCCKRGQANPMCQSELMSPASTSEASLSTQTRKPPPKAWMADSYSSRRTVRSAPIAVDIGGRGANPGSQGATCRYNR